MKIGFWQRRRGIVLCSMLGSMALASGCMSQNQAEVERLQSELQAARNEIATLKAQQPQPEPVTPASPAQPEDPAVAPEEPPPAVAAVPPAPPFDQQWTTFESEKRDSEWAFKRENGLLNAAKAHIKDYGARVNTVQCKTTTCAITIDVPAKPAKAYEPMPNPWADTSVTSAQKGIYNKQTRWTYLLQRHEKDYPQFGEGRIDPLALAASRAAPSAPAAAAPAPKAPAPAEAKKAAVAPEQVTPSAAEPTPVNAPPPAKAAPPPPATPPTQPADAPPAGAAPKAG